MLAVTFIVSVVVVGAATNAVEVMAQSDWPLCSDAQCIVDSNGDDCRIWSNGCKFVDPFTLTVGFETESAAESGFGLSMSIINMAVNATLDGPMYVKLSTALCQVTGFDCLEPGIIALDDDSTSSPGFVYQNTLMSLRFGTNTTAFSFTVVCGYVLPGQFCLVSTYVDVHMESGALKA